jgi:hypothetical protein
MHTLFGYFFLILGILCLIVLLLSLISGGRGPRGPYDRYLPFEYQGRGVWLSPEQIRSARKAYWISSIGSSLLAIVFLKLSAKFLPNTVGAFLHRIHFF